MARTEKTKTKQHLEQLIAYSRNVGAPSIEQMAREIAAEFGLELDEAGIEERRKA